MSLKHAILVLLETQPGSGYDLVKHFKGSLGYFWNATHQQVYLQLKKLLDEGLISYELNEQSEKPDKKVYDITNIGRSALSEWVAEPVKPNKINDALLVKLYGGHLTNTANLIKEIQRHKVIHENTLKQLQQIEALYLSLPKDKRHKYELPWLTLRRGLKGETAWLEWADEVLVFLKNRTA
jgi:PadR family transcriptional regulator AphA